MNYHAPYPPRGVATGRLARALTIAAAMLAALSAVSAPPAALQPGEPAPPFQLRDRTGKVHAYDPGASSPTLILSLKPGDQYTSPALAALKHLFQMHPNLSAGIDLRIVVSRLPVPPDPTFLDELDLPEWPVLLDPEDTFYRDYKIIATPTVTLVGRDGKVAAVHPGYDPGMIQHVRTELARVLGVSLPDAVTQKAAPPNMTLQMGRRMAQRGLWERALEYYQKAADEEPLSPEAQLELAEIHLELGQREAALQILDRLSPEQVDSQRLERAREQARQGNTPSEPASKPPKIYR